MEAHKQLRRQQDTAKRAGFHGAHSVFGYPNNNDYNNEATAEAFANLAQATAADRETVAALTQSMADLTKTIQTRDEEIKSLKQALKKKSGARDTQNPPSNSNSNGDNGNYCWTHGYKVNRSHTSATCSNKAQGHKDTATRADTMGGSTRGKPE
jgi:ABC-type transporter Mla subunit MlaD